MKFGGTSVASVESIQRVVQIIASALESDRVLVVVSAMGGVTERLAQAVREAGARQPTTETVQEILERHITALEALAHREELGAEIDRVRTLGAELEEQLRGCQLLGEASLRSVDSVLSYGERLSCVVVAAALRARGIQAKSEDTRDLVLTDSTFGNAQVDHEATHRRVCERLEGEETTLVLTGFIGSNPDGETTTLGRGGSDFTASILGAAVKADVVELWTDVDGVLEADPRLVQGAQPIPALSYAELMEMSYFGAKVAYPPCIRPARSEGIPLRICNTFRPDAPGTRITSEAASSGRLVRGISSVSPVSLLRLEGEGMVGMPGIAGRLLQALAQRDVNVILISQGSSEHSICLAVKPSSVASAVAAVEEEFKLEQQTGWIEALIVESDLSIVAVVGKGMRNQPGLAGQLFGILGRHGVNVHAIAQGSSELNVSIVVASREEHLAVRVLHQAFFATQPPVVDLFLAGKGRIGKELLAQLREHWPSYEAREGVQLRLAGMAGSQSWTEGAVPLEKAMESMKPVEEGGRALVDAALASTSPLRIFIDCTASADVAGEHEQLLANGVSVVTANKVPLAGKNEAFEAIMSASPGRYYCETTVGAGLPVIRTVADLLATGDRLRRLEGLLSGTLSFVLDRLNQGELFSRALRAAYDAGLTEPDPREDLSGRDVARKVLILGRMARWSLEPEDVDVTPLLPAHPWSELDLETFWQRLPEVDASFTEQVRSASAANRRLVYLSTLDDSGPRVGLVAVDRDHPCAHAGETDNMIAFTTDRYSRTPLVVKGPGAGPEVTAAGVFADLLRAISERPKSRATREGMDVAQPQGLSS